jgi:hypothetical protein
MELKDLDKLLKLLQKYGVRSYSTAQLTLSLDLTQEKPLIPNTPSEDQPQYTEEQILEWSSQAV